MVRNVGRHQTHAVVAACCGEITQCSPLVLIRVVQENLVSKGACRVSGVDKQGGEGRLSEAENLRSSSEIQSIFNLLGRTGKNIIFIIRVGI